MIPAKSKALTKAQQGADAETVARLQKMIQELNAHKRAIEDDVVKVRDLATQLQALGNS